MATPKVITTLTLPPDLHARLALAVDTASTTVSEWIRRAIAEKLERDRG